MSNFRDRLSSHAIQIVFVLLAVGLLVFSAMPHGLGQSSDSVAYLSAADSLKSGKGLIVFDGRPYVDWPPLYPVLLSIFAPSSAPFRDVLTLNAISLALLVWSALAIYRGSLGRSLYQWVFGAAVVFSFPLLRIHMMVFSEPVFVLLCLWALGSLVRYIESGEKKWYWLLVTLVGLSALQRLAGISLALFCGLALLILPRGSLLSRLKYAVALPVLSLLPVGLWLVGNALRWDTAAGRRYLEISNPFKYVVEILNGTSAWVMPRPIPAALRVLVWTVFIAASVWVIRRVLRASGRTLSVLDKATLLWIAVYSLFMVVMSSFTTTRSEELTERLASPIYISALYWFVRALSFFESELETRFGRQHVVKKYFAVGVLLWTLYPAAISARHVVLWLDRGVCPYRTEAWSNSQCLSWVREHQITQRIWSNHAEAFLVIDQRPAQLTPFVGAWERCSMSSMNDGEEGLLVWFSQFDGDIARALENFEAVSARVELTLIEELSDGRIYRVRRRSE